MSQEPKVTRYGALPIVDAELATKAYVDSGGGSGLTFARIIKSVDETINNDATLHNDLELFFAANANKTYLIWLSCFCTSGTAPDFRSAFSIPAGATGDKMTATWNGVQDQATSDVTVVQTTTMAAGLRLIEFTNRIITAGTAGNINFQWGQQFSNAGDTTVNQGATLLAWELE